MSTAVLAVNNIYCNQSQCIPVSLAHRLCFRGPQNQSARHYSRRNVYSTAGRTTADLVSQVGEGNLSSSLSLCYQLPRAGNRWCPRPLQGLHRRRLVEERQGTPEEEANGRASI